MTDNMNTDDCNICYTDHYYEPGNCVLRAIDSIYGDFNDDDVSDTVASYRAGVILAKSHADSTHFAAVARHAVHDFRISERDIVFGMECGMLHDLDFYSKKSVVDIVSCIREALSRTGSETAARLP